MYSELQIHKCLYEKNVMQFFKGFCENINILLVKEVQFQPKQHLKVLCFA